MVLAAADGDADARAELVEEFLPLIGSVARRYRGSRHVDHSELMQEGVVGLLTALKRYDRELDTPFWAYATWWVRYSMQQLVGELTRPVALSDRALRKLARVNEAHREHLQRHGCEPSVAELALAASLTKEQVETLVAVERRPRALEEPVSSAQDGGCTVGDLLADAGAEDAYDDVIRRLEVEILSRIPSTLCDRERAVLAAHFGLAGPARPLREIAGTLGLSAERVRQIEQRALEKLRAAVEC
jgi:RNA polymerase sigma factor (sigma-70 family)